MRNYPLIAIRRFCSTCQGGSTAAVDACPAKPGSALPCPLWRLRTGNAEDCRGVSRLKAIGTHCKTCEPDHPAACTAPDCVLYPFRLGSNPRIKAETRDRLREIARDTAAHVRLQRPGSTKTTQGISEPISNSKIDSRAQP